MKLNDIMDDDDIENIENEQSLNSGQCMLK